MPMDAVKKALADAVTEFLNSEDFADRMFDGRIERDVADRMFVEVHDVTPLENMVRVTGAEGGPRYFIVQVRESQ